MFFINVFLTIFPLKCGQKSLIYFLTSFNPSLRSVNNNSLYDKKGLYLKFN
jgi:hypothetical protein